MKVVEQSAATAITNFEKYQEIFEEAWAKKVPDLEDFGTEWWDTK